MSEISNKNGSLPQLNDVERQMFIYVTFCVRCVTSMLNVKSRSLQKNIAEVQKRDSYSFKRDDVVPGRDHDLDGRPGVGPKPRPHSGDRV